MLMLLFGVWVFFQQKSMRGSAVIIDNAAGKCWFKDAKGSGTHIKVDLYPQLVAYLQLGIFLLLCCPLNPDFVPFLRYSDDPSFVCSRYQQTAFRATLDVNTCDIAP